MASLMPMILIAAIVIIMFAIKMSGTTSQTIEKNLNLIGSIIDGRPKRFRKYVLLSYNEVKGSFNGREVTFGVTTDKHGVKSYIYTVPRNVAQPSWSVLKPKLRPTENTEYDHSENEVHYLTRAFSSMLRNDFLTMRILNEQEIRNILTELESATLIIEEKFKIGS